MRYFLLCLLACGCVSALDIERKHDGSVRVKLAETGLRALGRLREKVGEGDTASVPGSSGEDDEDIQELEIVLKDNLRRAQITQVELGEWKGRIVLWSDQEKMHAMRFAGLAFEEAVKRKEKNERLEKWGRGIGSFVGGAVKAATPWWIWYPLWGSVLVAILATLGSALVWLKARFWKKAARVLVHTLQDAPPDVREKTKGTPAQQVYYQERDHGRLNAKNGG